jgi:serine/threonine-protein kinase
MIRTAEDGEAYDRTVIEPHDPLIGTVLDQRFRIEHQLAAGGFGAIYRATDVLSDAQVALKVLLPRLARDPMVVARFRREGKTLATLRDPHTITAYEFGEAPDGTLYIVMELLHGESLYTRFRTAGPMPWRRVLHIAAGVCSSLAEAHALGVVHRDLKPANIHLEFHDGDPDFVKVLDFGIAKIVQGTDLEQTQLTQAGQMIGTVDYMSPEQMVGGELTPASDIYTLGVVMYEMIAGRTPFADAQTATAILAAVLTRAPDPLSTHARIPVLLDRIVARCLERDPQSRFTDVGDLVESLAEVAAGGAARQTPSVPVNEFAQTELTTEATRIDVRFSPSSQPVLDARGPRRRLPDAGPEGPEPGAPPGGGVRSDGRGAAPAASRPRQVTPAPPTVVGSVKGSQHAIDVRGMPSSHGSQHAIDARGVPPSHGSQHAIDARGMPSRGAQPGGALPQWSPQAVAPIATPLHGGSLRPLPAAAGGTLPPQAAGGTLPPPAAGGTLPPPAVGFGRAMPGPAMPPAGPAMPPAAQGTPRAAQAVVPVLPGSAMFPAVAPPPAAMQSPRPFFPIEPTVGAPRYSATFTAASGYDMAAAASYDKLVRRIIWAAVIIAVLAAVVIAMH